MPDPHDQLQAQKIRQWRGAAKAGLEKGYPEKGRKVIRIIRKDVVAPPDREGSLAWNRIEEPADSAIQTLDHPGWIDRRHPEHHWKRNEKRTRPEEPGMQGRDFHSGLDEKGIANFATSLVEQCREEASGYLWLLEGDLGAGKTTFMRHAATALGIRDMVNSPTFNLHNYYEGSQGDLNHFDLYRLPEESLIETEFAEIWESLPQRFTIHGIEWWSKLGSIHSRLPALRIKLEIEENPETRSVTVSRFPPGEVRY